MKTYGRKRTEETDDIIFNLDELCRLCLAKNEKLLPIFNEDDPVPLPIRIMACVALEVVEEDGLPKMICQPCHYLLERYYVFRKKCEHSDIKLRRHLKNIKEKDLVSLSTEKLPQNTVISNSNCEQQVDETDADASSPAKESVIIDSRDLLGGCVEYILDENECINLEDGSEEEGPCDITLPDLDSQRSAVTITEPQDDYGLEIDEVSAIESTEILARAICATLDNISAGADVNIEYPSTVEVITDDGTVIVMQLQSVDNVTEQPVNDQTSMPEVLIATKQFNAQDLCMVKEKNKHVSSERGVTCEVCSKWFTSRSALLRHFRVHTGEKPFVCHVCGRGFAQKEILKRHQMIHMDVRPFTCDQCGRGFTQREPLRRHLQSHAGYGERQIFLHKCDHCPKVFCHPSGLSRHTSTHMGRKFKCRNCVRQFADKSSLRRHLKQSHHQDLPPPTKLVPTAH